MSAVHPYSAFLLASVMQSSLVDERSLSYHIILSHYYPIRKDPLCNLISSFSHCCCCLCYCCRFFFSFSLSRCRPKKKTNKKNKTKKRERKREGKKGKKKERRTNSPITFFLSRISSVIDVCAVWTGVELWFSFDTEFLACTCF